MTVCCKRVKFPHPECELPRQLCLSNLKLISRQIGHLFHCMCTTYGGPTPSYQTQKYLDITRFFHLIFLVPDKMY